MDARGKSQTWKTSLGLAAYNSWLAGTMADFRPQMSKIAISLPRCSHGDRGSCDLDRCCATSDLADIRFKLLVMFNQDRASYLRLEKVIMIIFLWGGVGRFPAELGPETRSNGSGSENRP
jgi:hypothetical protein